MARIRTIKPEFWASEQIMECSPTTRLLFIGLWNFCDDGGNHPASVKTIRAEVFPGDNIGIDVISSLVSELVSQGLMIEYEVAGKRYWHVTGWHHQKIDKPTVKYPEPPTNLLPIAEHSTSYRREIGEPSPPEGKGEEGNGYIPTSDEVGCAQATPDHQQSGKTPDCPHQKIDKPTVKYPEPPTNLLPIAEHSTSYRREIGEPSPPEGKGEEGNGYIPTSDEVGCAQATPDHQQSGKTPDCPHQKIIELYAKHLPALPQPRIWDGKRADNLRARWRWVLTAKKPKGHGYANDLQSAMDFFDRFFGYVAASDFLTGRDGKWSGCDLAWLVKAENFAKVIEGKYENRAEVAA